MPHKYKVSHENVFKHGFLNFFFDRTHFTGIRLYKEMNFHLYELKDDLLEEYLQNIFETCIISKRFWMYMNTCSHAFITNKGFFLYWWDVLMDKLFCKNIAKAKFSGKNISFVTQNTEKWFKNILQIKGLFSHFFISMFG